MLRTLALPSAEDFRLGAAKRFPLARAFKSPEELAAGPVHAEEERSGEVEVLED